MTLRALLFASIALAACAHGTIAGTTIADTDNNRQVYDVIQDVQRALEARNATGIINHVSEKYFEDNGTPQQTDDYGYEDLVKRILPESLAATKEMQVSMQVQDIVVEGNAAYANIRYSSRARLSLPSGTLWDSHREFNRITLAKEDGAWKITSGL